MLNKPVVLLFLMVLAWLVPIILWLSLTLLLASALMNKGFDSLKGILAPLGWVAFGIYWFLQATHYIGIEDYFNMALTAVASFFCIYLALIIFLKGRSMASSWAGYAAGACGVIYFPFAEMEPLRSWLIGCTAQITASLLHLFSIPVAIEEGNLLVLDGRSVEIVLACTAIESIALFAGVIISVDAPPRRKLAALAASTLTIYLLNIFRNAFVLMAYGWNWFGDDSFYMAHNVIAKFGSVIALLAVAYLVFALLPELLALVDELGTQIRHPGGAA
jgi:archaeosortase A (PGF-CTERM-specific)